MRERIARHILHNPSAEKFVAAISRRTATHSRKMTDWLVVAIANEAEQGTIRSANTGEYTIFVDLANHVGVRQYFYGERIVPEIVRRIVRPGDCCIDAGANFGAFTCEFASIVGPHGRVITIEANPLLHDYLEKTILANRFEMRVNIETRAVYHTSGERLPFYLGADKGNQGISSLLHPDQRPSSVQQDRFTDTPVHVETVTLDDLIESLGIEYVRMLKIDVEGADEFVLQGAYELLASRRVATVVAEVAGANRPDRHLVESGMQVYQITGDGRSVKPHEVSREVHFADVIGVWPGSKTSEEFTRACGV